MEVLGAKETMKGIWVVFIFLLVQMEMEKAMGRGWKV